MGKYIITDPEGRLEDRGTVNKPHLHHISPGCRNKASLIFHLQIALTFVQVTIKEIFKNHVSSQKKNLGYKFNF